MGNIEVGDDVRIIRGTYGHKDGDYGRVMEITCPFRKDNYVVLVENRETTSVFPPGHVAYLRDNIELVGSIERPVLQIDDIDSLAIKEVLKLKENNNDLLLLL